MLLAHGLRHARPRPLDRAHHHLDREGGAVTAVARATATPEAVVGHSLGAAAAVFALRAGLSSSSVAPLAPVAEPWLFVRRLSETLGFSDARCEGLVAAIERRAGVGMQDIDGADAARSLDARALILHDPADRQVPFSQAEALASAGKGRRCTR